MIKSKKILIIGFVWPEPNSSAAGNRMMQLIDIFQSNGYEVTFASTALNMEFSEDLTKTAVKIKGIELNASSFDDFVSTLNPDFVLFDRFMVEEQFGWRVSENCPNALKILNTEDLHSLRNGRQLAVKEEREFQLDELFTSELSKREVASIYRCDVSLFVSEFEMELLKKVFDIPVNLICYLPLLADKLETNPNFEVREDFVFIGNFLHQPNCDAVQYLSNIIWPKIKPLLPKSKMIIYGAYPTQKVLQLHKPQHNFIIKGRAESAIDVVKNAKVVLAPIRFGAGIKGKLLEAMQCGTPSVTSSIGAEAMNGDLDWNGFIDDNPNNFAHKAVELYTNAVLWKKCQENGFDILEKRFKKSDFENNFIASIESLLLNLDKHRTKNFIGSMLQHHYNSSTKYMSKWIEEKNKKM